MKRKKSKHCNDTKGKLVASEGVIVKETLCNITESTDNTVTDCKGPSLQANQNNEPVTSEITQNKPKRKRVRKHKRKKKSQSLKDSTLCQSDIEKKQVVSDGSVIENVYIGKEVKEKEIFYGHLPDKLEPPKYYRHGYRNKNIYEAQPNNHKKFDSDSDIEEGSMEQYNFLSRLRTIEPDVVVSTDVEMSVNSQAENSFLQNQSVNENNSHYENSVNNTSSDSRNVSAVTYNGEHEESPLSSNSLPSVSTSPAHNLYPPNQITRTTNGVQAVSQASPTLLCRTTLSNGASVFSRCRSSPRQQMSFEMSKEDQLNTISTNKSTIFLVKFICSIGLPSCF